MATKKRKKRKKPTKPVAPKKKRKAPARKKRVTKRKDSYKRPSRKAKRKAPARKAKRRSTKKRKSTKKTMTLAQARRVVNLILNHSRNVREGSALTLEKDQVEEMVKNIEHVCGGSKMRGINYLIAKFGLTRKAAAWYVGEYCAATQRNDDGVYFAEAGEGMESIYDKIKKIVRPKRWYDLSF